MNLNKPLIILACLLAAAIIPSCLADGFSVGPGWTLSGNTQATPTPSTFITPTPTPFDSTNPTPDVTANPTGQVTANPTATEDATTNPTEQPTPTPTAPEFNILIIVILLIICGAGIVLTVNGLKGGVGQ